MEGTRKLPFPLDAAPVLYRSQKIPPLIRIKDAIMQSDINVRKQTRDTSGVNIYSIYIYIIFVCHIESAFF